MFDSKILKILSPNLLEISNSLINYLQELPKNSSKRLKLEDFFQDILNLYRIQKDIFSGEYQIYKNTLIPVKDANPDLQANLILPDFDRFENLLIGYFREISYIEMNHSRIYAAPLNLNSTKHYICKDNSKNFYLIPPPVIKNVFQSPQSLF
jgi:hypothetical protein